MDQALPIDRRETLEGIGCSRKRREDPRFIQGRGNYVDDIKLTVAAPIIEHGFFEAAERMLDGSALSAETTGGDYIVVATQGSGDLAALTAALSLQARYVAFVGSRRKSDVLRASLESAGVVPDRIASIRMPAGLDLGAITPDEIAFAIVAEIISVRRQGQRQRSPSS